VSVEQPKLLSVLLIMQLTEIPLYQPLSGLGQGLTSLMVDFAASSACDAEEKKKWLNG